MDSNKLEITNEKFKFMGFLDYARWCDCGDENDNYNNDTLNYYSINLANKNASGEEVLYCTPLRDVLY